jgi:hypothetical protein
MAKSRASGAGVVISVERKVLNFTENFSPLQKNNAEEYLNKKFRNNVNGKEVIESRAEMINRIAKSGGRVEAVKESVSYASDQRTQRKIEESFRSANVNVVRRDLGRVAIKTTPEFEDYVKSPTIENKKKAIKSLFEKNRQTKTAYRLYEKNSKSYYQITQTGYQFFEHLKNK